MGIGRIIGGALAGIGEGLEKQSILAEDTRQKQSLIDMQARRDAALEALRHANKTDELTTESGLIDTRDANHQARNFAYDTSTAAQKQGFEQQNIRLKGAIDLNNDKQIEALKQQYHLTDIQVQSMADTQKELTVAGQTADHWAVTTDGKMVAFNKKGDVLRYSAHPDSFIPSGKSETDSGGDLGTSIGDERASRGGAKPATATAPTGQQSPDQKRQHDAAMNALAAAYAEASQNPQAYRSKYPGMFDANGNLLPKDVLIQRVNQRYGG